MMAKNQKEFMTYIVEFVLFVTFVVVQTRLVLQKEAYEEERLRKAGKILIYICARYF